MVDESRTVQALVQHTQQRLQDEHSKATDLTQRVSELEDELRRLSDEVSTDQLTQIANRRGLMQAFEVERARLERKGGRSVDRPARHRQLQAPQRRARPQRRRRGARSRWRATCSSTLRPIDVVARYGGEEFVVLLPETPVDEGEQVLTRLQRSLTGGLFMHKEKQVFVTFSAGVTALSPGERLEDALERADQALYEAKRTGKNRTCIG